LTSWPDFLQTTYLAQEPGLNAGKTEKAILEIREWREKGELPFPDFSPETIAKIHNQLEYPPADSALGRKKKE
jgi:MscS family membrane protein